MSPWHKEMSCIMRLCLSFHDAAVDIYTSSTRHISQRHTEQLSPIAI